MSDIIDHTEHIPTAHDGSWYRRLFEAAPVPILVADHALRLVDANAAARSLLGIPDDGAGGMPFTVEEAESGGDTAATVLTGIVHGDDERTVRISVNGSSAAVFSVRRVELPDRMGAGLVLAGQPGGPEPLDAAGAVQRENRELSRQLEDRERTISSTRGRLEDEIHERRTIQHKLSERERALEALFRVTRTHYSSFTDVCAGVADKIALLLEVPCVRVNLYRDGALTAVGGTGPLSGPDTGECGARCQLCLRVVETGRIVSCATGPGGAEKGCHGCMGPDTREYLGLPVATDDGMVRGVVAVFSQHPVPFRNERRKAVEVLTGYLAVEIERERLVRQVGRSRQREIVGRLTSGVAHEVRNPLNAILSYSQVLKRALHDDDELRECTGRIAEQVDRLSMLMNDLLQLGRPLQVDELVLRPAAELFRQAIDTWRKSASRSGYRVRFEADGAACALRVRADEVRFQQVLVNLLENASQHSSPDAEITCRLGSDRAARAVFQVSDRGTGIPRETMERIFEPFYSTRRGGTGLGMSIVRHLVLQHGGTVDIVNNAPPPGCTATVTLPAVREHTDEKKNTAG